jgi:two-component system cell cycle response regulator
MAELKLINKAPDRNAKSKSKILIVDDSATIRATLTKAVKNEFDSVDATNGEQAWNMLQQDESIKVVVTDLAMPELDGYGLIKRMRNCDISRIETMPVIVVTGANDTVARERAFINGANDFITKTSDHVEFLARVRAHEKLAQTIRELEESRRFLREQANTDPLTKLANRRSYFQVAASNMAQMQRQNEHYSMLMLDIDHFKRINDTYGHQAGDYILIELAKVLSSAVREGDTVARIGGEEFVVSSPYTNRLAAIVLAERLRKAAADRLFEFDGNKIPVTISIGVASLTKGIENVDQLMAITDSRLYLAKQRGRNRICASDKNAPNDKLADDVICPKVEEAIMMIKHGNTFRLESFLPELAEQLAPLLKLLHDKKVIPVVNLDEINRSIESLDKD